MRAPPWVGVLLLVAAAATLLYMLGNPPQGPVDPARSARLATAVATDFGRTSWFHRAVRVEVRGGTARIVTDIDDYDDVDVEVFCGVLAGYADRYGGASSGEVTTRDGRVLARMRGGRCEDA